MKIDLHVHSRFSNRPGEFMLKAVKTGECYTSPERVHELCRGRGMDMVTLTDHDTIDGALEIAHLRDTFISEEITAVFPEDGMKAHVVALDIDEAQHREIQRLRPNIYELASYLRDQEIPHFAAHPLSGPDAEFEAAHVRKLILLFRHLEGYNGTRERESYEALKRILSNLSAEEISRWALMYGIDPVSADTERILTAGSDDHGAIGVARCYTVFDRAETNVASLREAFAAGRMRIGGEPGNGRLLSHSIYSVAMQYFQSTGSHSAFNSILDGGEESADGEKEGRGSLIARTVSDRVNSAEDLSLEELVGGSHTEVAQHRIGELGRDIVRSLLGHYTAELFEAATRLDLERAFDAVPGLLSATSVLLPYLFGYRYSIRDRETAERISEELGAGDTREARCKVAIFTDTGFDINGVAIGLRRLVRTVRGQGGDVRLVVCGKDAVERRKELSIPDSEMTVLPSIRDLTLPMYDEMSMGIPSLVDVLDFLATEKVRVVQVSTPGPLGLMALLAAKLCGLPVVANYHTEIAQYAERLTGDASFASLVKMLVGAFYRQADHVIVPSRAVVETLVEYGVERERVRVLRRGVDTRRFDPAKRDRGIWARWNMNGAAKILYVGRVSKEKGLDDLLSAYEMVKETGLNADLAVVGDGPYLEELRERAGGDVAFLGYRMGADLDTLYASSDVFAFPSATDTFGNVVLEAQASGLPAIVVDRGGPPEQVAQGANGLVVPAGDARALAVAIDRLVRDPDTRKSMGENARTRAQGYSLAASAKAHWGFYVAVMRESSGASSSLSRHELADDMQETGAMEADCLDRISALASLPLDGLGLDS